MLATATAEDIQAITLAASLASDFHLEQKRKGSGRPYATHPIRVAHLAARAGLSVDAICAAFLHDSIEDCGVTGARLRELGVSARTTAIVKTLSKWWSDHASQEEKNEGKVVYYANIISDPEVLTIKLLDRADNLWEMRRDLDEPYGNLKWSRNYARKTRTEFIRSAVKPSPSGVGI